MRVLVVRVGAMGDVLHGLPAVLALQARHPDWHLGWAIEPRWQALIAGAGQGVDRVHSVAARAWNDAPFSRATAASILTLRRQLHAERYDVCLDLQGTLRSAAIGWISGAPRRIGSANPRERAARLLYTQRVPLQAQHVVRQACELAGAISSELLSPASVRIPADPAAEAWFRRQIGQEGFALLIPTAGWGAKQWPAERYADLAARLQRMGLRVLVNAATADASSTRQLQAETVCCSVAELIALTRRAAVVIGGDTGPVHLAAALGRPVVALFGPTDPRRNGPAGFTGARAAELRDPASATSHKRLVKTDPGLAGITVDKVMQAVRERIGG